MHLITPDNITKRTDDLANQVDALQDTSVKINPELDTYQDVLKAYQKQLIKIADQMNQSEFAGLWDLMAIYIEGIDKLIESDRHLKPEECHVLKRFPVLLADYVSVPLSKIPATLLLRLFKNPEWIRPITENEEKILIEFISPIDLDTDQIEWEEEVRSADTESAESVLDLNSFNNVINLEDIGKSQAERNYSSEQEIDITAFNVDSTELDSNDMTDEISLDSFIKSDDASEIDNKSITYDVDYERNDNVIDDDNDAVDLNHIIEQCNNDNSISDDEVPADELLQNINDSELPSEYHLGNLAEHDDPGIENNAHIADDSYINPYHDLDQSQQELIDVVRAELAEIIESRDEDIISLQQEPENEGRIQSLEHLGEQLENLSNAVELIGLEGFSLGSHHLACNVRYIAENNIDITDDLYHLIYEWPVRFLGYLQDIFNQNRCDDLLDYLQHALWPVSLDNDQVLTITNLLHNPVFVEEEVEQRQVTATKQDVSLVLPEEVNQELLDGLLQDLPGQTEEFTSAIHHLSEGGTQADIEVAQRIAHTLKGAANVVGVKGIANLTHHLEDILQALSKANKKPTKTMLDVLVNASDCLEAMTESLLGIDEQPQDAQKVLQDVLDCANRLDKEGIPDESDNIIEINEPQNVPSVSAKTELSLPEVQETQNNVEAVDKKEPSNVSENMLRIPAKLADDLLRLAGENLISTAQVEDRIKNTLKRQDALSTHNQSLQQLSFDLEHLIDIQGITTNLSKTETEMNSDFDPLEMDQYHELHSVSRRLVEIAADSMEIAQLMKTELSDLQNLVIMQDQLQKESQELVLRTRMVPVKTIIPRLKRGVRQACRLTGKQVELTVIDNDTYMDSEVLNDLIEPLMHVLRNAVDHGVESEEERLQSGKSATGHINLVCDRKGDQVVIRVMDDGRGLNAAVIHDKAMSKGIIKSEQDITEDNIYRLILEPGFSTKSEVTQVSGRGIGLDVVNVKVRQLKGSIIIDSTPGLGSRFELIIPISSFSVHSLLVRVREHVYAISNRGVEEILYPGAGELCDVGNETIFKLGDQIYEAIIIDSLLHLPTDRRQISRESRPIILVRDDFGTKKAILVQDVLDSRDVVVKPMGKYMPKINGTVGATVLGDGSVAPVIDLPELLHGSVSHLQSTDPELVSTVDAETSRLMPYVLVVDDSLSARRSLAQFAEDMGMNVRTARDGMEAVSLIEVRKPDLVLVDMEMPRMNGLELTSHIRANEATRNVPVIMVTSRSTEKHRQTAINKGVNHFMVKPFDEDQMAQYIHETLRIAS